MNFSKFGFGFKSAIVALAAVSLLAAMPVMATVATVTVTSQSGSVIYTDLPTNDAVYIAVSVQTDIPVADAWVKMTTAGSNIQNVGSGVHQLKFVPDSSSQPTYAGPDPSSGLAANSAKTFFFLVSATALSGTPQNLTFSLYDGNPGSGGSLLGSGDLPFTVDSTIKAHANKPNVVVTVPNNPQIGQLGQITFTGCTGTVGSNKRLYFTPISSSTWAADTFEIIDSNINLAGYAGNDYKDILLIPNGDVLTSDHCYTAIYNFVINGEATATVTPINYIDSGQHLKYTAPGGGTFAVVIPKTCEPPHNVTLAPSPGSIPTVAPNTPITTVTFTAAQAGNSGNFVMTETGSLPNGVQFTDNGDGTATLSGTPTNSGSFNISVKAHSNLTDPSGCEAVVSFRFTVAEPVVSTVPAAGPLSLLVLALLVGGIAFHLIRARA